MERYGPHVVPRRNMGGSLNMGEVQPVLEQLLRLLDVQIATGTITLTLNQRVLVSVEEKKYRRFVKRGEAPVINSSHD